MILTLFACFAVASAFGQAGLERQVVGSAGMTLHATSGATLDYTVGEVAVTETRNDDAILSPGFHQIIVAPLTLDAGENNDAPLANIQVFPNPARDFLQLHTDMPLQATLFDLNGRQVIPTTPVETTTQLEVGALPAGTYVLRTITADGKPLQNFKIQIVR